MTIEIRLVLVADSIVLVAQLEEFVVGFLKFYCIQLVLLCGVSDVRLAKSPPFILAKMSCSQYHISWVLNIYAGIPDSYEYTCDAICFAVLQVKI